MTKFNENGWCYDMSKAPKGKTITREHTSSKGKLYTKDYHIDHRILTAPPDPQAEVIPSYWIASEGAWAGYMPKTPPVAWRYYPEHPMKDKS